MAVLIAVVGLLMWGAPAAAQVATGNVAGTIKDAQGGVIPGATVSLVSQTRGTVTDTVSNTNGDFVFVNVPQDTYTVKVTMDGFKTLERHDVPVSPGDRVALGTLPIEVGTLNETITVSGEAPLIQSRSGERSYVASTEVIQNLPLNSRNWTSLVAMAPGVVGTARLGSGGQNNYQLDGVTTNDTGSNGQMLQLNTDAIAEVKVVTQGYAAEYGRASGLQMSAITKSGSNQIRGSVYDIRRDSDWNANSWANVRNGITKAVSKQQDWGYTLGGPVGKPGGSNKLFFFYAHQFSPRTTGGGDPARFRVPTALERAGDFSQSLDNQNALFNLIRDSSTGLPCTAANTAGCFQDGGVVGRIPANRLYPIGLNILKLWPLPNASGLGYNYEAVPPIDKRMTHQPVTRVDYQVYSKLRISAKYAGQRATVKPTAGSIPGFNDVLNAFPFTTNYSTTVDYAINGSTVLEGTYGFIRVQQAGGGGPGVTPSYDRCNVGLCDIPFLFPNFGVLPEGGYQQQILTRMKVPYLVNNTLRLPPRFSFGNRIANQPPNLQYPNYTNITRTNDVSISLTKVKSSHTLKAGFFLNHSLKAQNLGQQAGANPFQGQIAFDNDTNNPLDSGFGFANAALGIFSSYGQQSSIVDGNFIYNNVEWYLQDNWKVNSQLTLDYGLRFTNQQPQYDSHLQASNFFTDKWTRANAPRLYLAACPGNVNPCATANRQAMNPVTGVLLGAGSAPAIGTIVPNTGSLTNGLIKNGDGIAKTNYTWPTLVFGPRVGAAYDVGGDQRMVVRGSIGLFFDRPDGDSIYPQIGNPPTSTSSVLRYSTLQSIGTGGLSTQAASALNIFQYDAKVPSATQWNLGTQMQLPAAITLDLSYVGNHGFNLLQSPRGNTAVMDLNAPDFGAAYLPQNQDPTLAASSVPGSTALLPDQLRPYTGYNSIFYFAPIYKSTYHSIQMSLNRRMRNGLQFGGNYTYSASFKGNAGVQGGTPGIGLRLNHNADGTYTVRDDQAQWESLMSNMGRQPHVIKINAMWVLPKLADDAPAKKALGYVVNDWQLSGVLTAGSGSPYDATFTYQNNGAPINLTGSPAYNGRIVLKGDPGKGCSSDPYKQFDTSAFAGPTYNSLGLESGRNLLLGCPDHTLDLAIARNIPVGGSRSAQFRIDLFNALNSVVYSNRVTQLQLTNPIDQVVRNPQFNADGTVNAARIKPTDAGFGAVTAAQAMRTVQVQLRFQF
ncbi:MAG TPA: carboxypeptidase-like regulatory domain-containing protein [Vicinamibacterales bacterium]|nr:carboxypeptidase-like regulatory domain-containing protein [Vicinamibacterales bacterium]